MNAPRSYPQSCLPGIVFVITRAPPTHYPLHSCLLARPPPPPAPHHPAHLHYPAQHLYAPQYVAAPPPHRRTRSGTSIEHQCIHPVNEQPVKMNAPRSYPQSCLPGIVITRAPPTHYPLHSCLLARPPPPPPPHHPAHLQYPAQHLYAPQYVASPPPHRRYEPCFR